MKINSIINRYLFAEMIGPFVINLVFFTFIFLMAEMLKITDLIVNYGVGIFTILIMLVYSTPYFLVYVIPMSIMMAVLLTFMRLSGDKRHKYLSTASTCYSFLSFRMSANSFYGCLWTAVGEAGC